MARVESWIQEVEGLYYLCGENKGVDQLRGCRTADLRLCFHICKISGFLIKQSSHLLAHLSQWLIGELIGYPWSGVRRCPSTISNVFSSETPWPIKAKFYVEPPWEGGTKVYINGPGHMTT